MTTAYIHPLDIGSVHLENNVTLAPMAGFTNVAFRLIAKQVGGCGLVASEMVAALSPDASHNSKRFAIQTRTVPEEKPVAMQVYGREPSWCADIAQRLHGAGADIIDLNCGCPVKKAKQSGSGVALMREPEQVGKIVAAMCAAVTCPVMVKMRLGFDAENQNAIEVGHAAVENGAVALCVHARTGENKHGTDIDLAGLAAVKESTTVPVLANGDMHVAENIRRAKDEAGVDGYSIGRAACGDPWLFRNLIAELTGGELYNPSIVERRDLLEQHFDIIVSLFGEERGCRIMRKYTFFYCNGLPGVRKFRNDFMQIKSVEQFNKVVSNFFGQLRS